MSDLERELEQELHRILDPIVGQPIPPRRAIQNRRRARALLGGAGAALSFKMLTGVAVAAAAVTVAGAATTGSLDPTVWGQQVSARVADCKAKLADGQHGIGDCVSSFASQHGASVASAARQHGNGNQNGHGNGNNGNANGKDKDKTKIHPTPPKNTSAVQSEAHDPPTSHAPIPAPPGR